MSSARDVARPGPDRAPTAPSPARDVIDGLPDATVVLDGDGRVRHANPAALALLGLAAADVVGHRLDIPVVDADRAELELAGPADRRVQLRIRTSTLEWEGRPARLASLHDAHTPPDGDGDGDGAGAGAGARSARPEVHAGGALVEQVPDVLFRCGPGPRARLRWVSAAARAVLGHDPATLGDGTWDLAGLLRAEDQPALAELLAGRTGWELLRVRAVRADGSTVPVELHCAPVVDVDGATVEVVGVARDVSAREASEQALAVQALHDPLTGLANRALFTDRVEQAASRRHPRDRAAVLFVDLDGFKAVNDSQGHDAGDQLLREIGARLRRSVRPSDTVARLGGDEFAVLCDDLEGEEGALAVAWRIVRDAARPMVIDGHEVAVGASVGAAMLDQGRGVDDVLRRADLAMYRAKSEGRGRAVLFDVDMAQQLQDLLAVKRDLEQSLAADRFELRYQPEVDLASGRVVGLQASLRWNSPELGLRTAAEVVPAAEQAGLAGPLVRWMLDEAAGAAARWSAAGADEDLLVSVPLSARMVRLPDLVALVRGALAAADVEPRHLGLEVPEELLTGRDDVSGRLEELRDLGVVLTIGSFGTGASSMRHLRHLPVHRLKVDASLMAGLGQAADDTALVQAISSLGVTLWMAVVADGVATAAQRDMLVEFGCTVGQGPLFGPPLAAADVPARLAADPSSPGTRPAA